MSDNYTGDGTMVGIGPDPGPGPEVAPVGVLFEDGEEADAASVEQLFKTLLNHLAYLYKPKGSTSTAIKFMKRWRTVLGHTRFALDRLGLPSLTYLHWQELWDYVAFVTTGAQQNVYLSHSNRWKAWTSTPFTGTVKGIFVGPAGRDRLGGPGTPGCGRVLLAGCDGEDEFVAIGSGAGCRLDPEADAVLEWIGTAQNGSEASSTPEILMGIAEAWIDDDTNLIDPREVRGLKFIRQNDENNWQAVARDGAGETIEDTGVAVSGGAKLRFRIEFRGASVNETSVAAAYFFIDGTLVATITDNLPLGIGAQAMMAVKNTGGVALTRVGGLNYDAVVGPVSFACNLIPRSDHVIVDLVAIRLDGSTPAEGIEPRRQRAQEVRWPVGFSGIVRAPVLNENGTVLDLTGTRQRLTIRRTRSDATPLLCLESTSGEFTITDANANKAGGRCTYDVVVIEEDGAGKRWQVVPTGPWIFTDSASKATDTVTP